MTEMYLFPDTNVFLHYPPIDQINWKSLSGTDRVTIVLCNEVIRELDDKKGDSRLGDRASRAIKDIDQAEESKQEIAPGVTVEVFARTFRSSGLSGDCSPDNGDDRIVTLVQQYQIQNPARQVAVVTEDYGMKSRCKSSGVKVIRLDNSIRLANPQDELAKKYKQAIQELAALKSRQPSLRIQATNPNSRSNDPPTYRLTKSWQPVDVEAKIVELAQSFPKYDQNHSGSQPAWVENIFPSPVRPLTPEERAAYNQKVDEYVAEYASYLELTNLIEDIKERTLYVELQLSNDGTSIASDVDIAIHWPSTVQRVAKQGSKEANLLERPLEEPNPPVRPSPMRNLRDFRSPSPFQSLALSSPLFNNLTAVRSRYEDYDPEVKCKNESETCKTLVRLNKVKHGHSISLGTFLVSIDYWENCKPFEAEFVISASELPSKISGKIPLIVKVEVETIPDEAEG